MLCRSGTLMEQMVDDNPKWMALLLFLYLYSISGTLLARERRTERRWMRA